MKKLSYLIVLALILGLVLTGCTLLSNVGQVPTNEQNGISYLTKAGTEANPEVMNLLAGQTNLVGEVRVWNDADDLYVKYVITDLDWCLTETHLHVATSLGDIPQTKKFNPIPGQFDHKRVYDPCVQNDTYIIPMSLIPGDSLYIAAHAVVSDAPKGQVNGVIYATRISGGTRGLYEIDVVNASITLLKEITGYTNGLAYDPFSHKLYFTAPPRVNVSPSPLWSYDITEDELVELCNLPGSVVGASFYGDLYHYIAEKTNELISIEVNNGCLPTIVCSGFGIASDFTFGDFAISNTGMLYGSTRVSPQMFFSLDITDYNTYNEFVSLEAVDLQLAYGSNGKLYGTNHEYGYFYEVNEDTGEATMLSLRVAGFSDLASGELFIPRIETAWAAGFDFSGKNWATYFTYTVPLHQIEVFAVSSTPVEVDLDVGSYKFVVSGIANAGDTIDFDAKYSITNRIIGDKWTDAISGYPLLGPEVLDLHVNGATVEWGDYNVEHIYEYEFSLWLGGTVTFCIYDTYPINNSGHLIVEIYEQP